MPDPHPRPSSPAPSPNPLSIIVDDGSSPPPSRHRHRPSRSASSDDIPVYSALNSTAALVLIHDDDDDGDDGEGDDRDVERPLTLDFSTDEDEDELDHPLSPLYQIHGRLSIPPLPPSTIFLYLLSPYLKLGALLLPYHQLPLKYGLSSLLVSAVLAAVTRHLLYLLARYLRKADLEEVVSSTFVGSRKRGRRIEKQKNFFRFLVKFGIGLLRIFIAVLYLRECVLLTLPLLTSAPATNHLPAELMLALTLVIFALLLSSPRSLASKVVVYTTRLSVFAYLLWLATITFLYIKGILPTNPDRSSSSNIWSGIITTAFIFTSSNTLPLYASTKGTIQPLLFDASTSLSLPTCSSIPSGGNTVVPRQDGSMKQPLYRSFKFLSLLSIGTALGMVLPLVGFAAFPNMSTSVPAANNGLSLDDMNAPIGYSEQIAPEWNFPLPSGESPATRIQTYITPALASLTLFSGIPQLLITIPAFPPGLFEWFSSGHKRTSPAIISKLSGYLKKSASGLLVTALTLFIVFCDTSNVLMPLTTTLSLLATFYIPSTLHIFTHTFKSPLSIILPSSYLTPESSAPTPSVSHMPTATPTPGLVTNENSRAPTPITSRVPPQPHTFFGWPRHRNTRSQQEHDELLQRKERALQRRQMRRRIVWDLWAWALFLGGLVALAMRVHSLVG